VAGAARSSGYSCAECGWRTTKWVGRCSQCEAWGTLAETVAPVGRVRALPGAPLSPALPIDAVSAEVSAPVPTGVGELDRVLGGGLVPGAVVLLAGEPGVGKSTLLLQVAARAADAGRCALYVTGEESAAQVRMRAARIGALSPRLYLAAETDLDAVLGQVAALAPALVVLDSVQTVAAAGTDGVAGGVTQVREVAAALTRVAKETGTVVLLVGHVTKDGSVAGPRSLEHLVDVVCQFEGERTSRLRMVRATKNRFGPCDEVGCFDFVDGGLAELADPSGLFLSERTAPVPGTCVTVSMDGRRALVAEVQALVAASSLPSPRRATSGLDAARVAMVLAVTERRAGVRLGAMDVFAATVGGVRLAEPAADLALVLAVASAASDRPVRAGTVALGEVGLSGELRRVSGSDVRLAEAARLGFATALVPPGTAVGRAGLRVVEVADVAAARAAALGGE